MSTPTDSLNENKCSPLVSVVIPAYRVAEFIGEAVGSVLAQTFSDYEIVVVNDGSPDTSELERVLASYQGKIVYVKQENKGVSAARNTGIRAARGSFIAFLDGDDVWEPNYLEIQLSHLQNHPTSDVVYSDAVLFGDPLTEGKKFSEFCPSDGEVSFENLIAEKCNVMLSGSVVKKEMLLKIGMFDEKIRYTEDFELWLRVIKNGGRITYHQNALVRHRTRSGSTSASDPVWLYEHIIATLKRIPDKWSLTERERVVLQQRLQFNAAMLHRFKAKKAFSSGDTTVAINEFREANRFFRKAKISIVIFLLRVAPRLLMMLHDARNRLQVRGAA